MAPQAELGQRSPLLGRRAVVTGANSGLGFETSSALARLGASVVLACRNEDRAVAALESIRRDDPSAEVTWARLDLADLASVRVFAEEQGAAPLDILVNNAGVMAIPRRLSEQGIEMQFATNHLGHFALTGLMLPALLRAPSARVVTVSSFMHVVGRMALDDLPAEHGYHKWAAYGRSKLANLLFCRELDRRASAAGAPLISVAAHPGYAATNLQGAGPAMEGRTAMVRVTEIANRVFAQSAAAGARPIVFAAVEPGIRGGQFFGPRYLMWGDPAQSWSRPRASDVPSARRLWDVSVQLTGVDYAAL